MGDALAVVRCPRLRVDAVASIVPTPLLPKAGALAEAVLSSTPEELRLKAQRFVADHDTDRGSARNERLRANQSVSFFRTDTGMGAMFGQWDPEGSASVEATVDHVAEQLWRQEHPHRNPRVTTERVSSPAGRSSARDMPARPRGHRQ